MMPVDRHMLLDWLLPHCEPDTVSVMYAKARGDGPGWINGADDVARAITADRAGTLAGEEFASITKDGRRYTIAGGTRLGLVPHRDGMVTRFCLDLDDHDGGGKNGKTVFLEGLRLLLGDGHTARTPTPTLLAKRGETIPNDLARLRGIRLVTASETGDGNCLDEALVKDITGGNRVVVRFMRGEWFEFTLHFKIFLSTNYRPRISGTDDAIWDRLRLVPFVIRIPEEERRPMDQMLCEFEAELPGILNWAIAGCLDWQRHGLGPVGPERGPTGPRPLTPRRRTRSRSCASVPNGARRRPPSARRSWPRC